MNGDKFISILASIVLVCPVAVFADESDSKRDADFAFTCATPVRSKAEHAYPVKACSIEMIPVGNVYIGIVEDLLATNSNTTSLNHVNHVVDSIRADLAPGLNVTSDFGIQSFGQLGSATLEAGGKDDQASSDSEQQQQNPSPIAKHGSVENSDATPSSVEMEKNLAQMLQPMVVENEIPLIEPQKHDIDEAKLEDENGLLHPTKIAADRDSSVPALVDPIHEKQEVVAIPKQQPDLLSDIRMNFSDVDVNVDTGQHNSTMENDESNRVESLPSTNDAVAETLIVHPPMIQPYNRNQHTFVIENRGINSARDVTVEIKVPESVRIVAALPINSVFSPHTAVFRFDEIIAGDKVQVHLTAVNKLQGSISFVANVSAKSTYEFGAVAANDPEAALEDVSYNLGSATTGLGNVEPRSAAVIKNPYVDKNSDIDSATRR